MTASIPAAETARLRSRLRGITVVFMIGLVVSGLTAFPLLTEVRWLAQCLSADPSLPISDLRGWIGRVLAALEAVDRHHHFLPYGTDWLAFGHLVIALFFIGPYRDPVANAWVFRVGLVACAGVIPLALICGAIRGVPFYWRLVDCSFGVFGAVLLTLALRWSSRLRTLTFRQPPSSDENSPSV
ncbi:MAG: hypothetical protein ABI680_00920 [Chthoniobacteraceae bacterium]